MLASFYIIDIIIFFLPTLHLGYASGGKLGTKVYTKLSAVSFPSCGEDVITGMYPGLDVVLCAARCCSDVDCVAFRCDSGLCHLTRQLCNIHNAAFMYTEANNNHTVVGSPQSTTEASSVSQQDTTTTSTPTTASTSTTSYTTTTTIPTTTTPPLSTTADPRLVVSIIQYLTGSWNGRVAFRALQFMPVGWQIIVEFTSPVTSFTSAQHGSPLLLTTSSYQITGTHPVNANSDQDFQVTAQFDTMGPIPNGTFYAVGYDIIPKP